MEKILNQEFKSVFEWLCANRSKTEFIIFKPPKKPLNQRIVLNLNGKKMFESPKIKYLGIILDPFLRWHHHINELTKKLNRMIGMIYKIRYNCTKSVLLSLYFRLFHSHLSYGLSVWGTSNNDTFQNWLYSKRKLYV